MDTHEDSNEGPGSANIVYHYPADLLQLLIDVIPLLCRSKRDVLTFFRSAGVRASFLDDLDKRLRREPEKLNKYEIARTVLTLLNEKGEPALRERREVLRRVVEWEDFSTCYADNRERAQYLVVQIQRLVGVKDAFTRMRMEREAEKKLRQAKFQAKQDEVQQRKAELAEIKADLYALFSHSNPQQRGKALEGVLNRLFKVSGFHVRDAFALSGFKGDISPHLVRLYSRSQVHGIFISASEYTGPAIAVCRDALRQGKVIVLCDLKEIVVLLEQEQDLKDFLKAKVRAARIDRNPLYHPV
jgi:restriction system protein